MGLDINKKIEGIMQSVALDDLSLKYLPPVADNPSDYYFISYSHKDYKQVYSDIYALQAEGVNIWYDRAMPAGESWERTAEKYIRPSRCAGVVFYVSENSLLSPAIHKEIEFAKQCGKSCLTINLPLNDGKSYSASQMLDIMIANGAQIPADKYSFIAQTFNDDVLYLPYSQSAEHKAEKILRLEKPLALQIEKISQIDANVVAVNDIEIQSLASSDFYKVDAEGKQLRIYSVFSCAFANCRAIQRLEMPKTVAHIGNYAFLNCQSLTSIDLPNISYLGENVFSGCSNLSQVNFYDNKALETISSCAFYRCSSLQSISIPANVTSIGSEAFAFSGLAEIAISKTLTDIDPSAFVGCKDLVKITVDCDNPNYTSYKNCLIGKQNKTLLSAQNDCVLPNDGSILAIAPSAFQGVEKFSMSRYYEQCESDIVAGSFDSARTDVGCHQSLFHHNEFGDIDIRRLWLDENTFVVPQGVQIIYSGTFERIDMCGIVLPDSIKKIQSFAFANCYRFRHICYLGTKAQWDIIEKGREFVIGNDNMQVRVDCLDCSFVIEL